MPQQPRLAVDTTGLRRLVSELESEILERRRAEEKVRQSEERFRMLAENARDIVYRFRLGPDAGFEYISPVVAQITGHTPGQFYRDSGLGLRLVHPEDRQLVDDYLQAADYGRPLSCRCRHRDGHTLWLEGRSLPIYDRDGKALAVEGIARDVTEERRLLAGLAQYSRSLEEKDQLLREFSTRTIRLQEEERLRVARQLHDGVNQLLCGVGFGLELVCRDAADDRVTDGLQRVRDLVDRSIRELRRISENLRPPALDDLGLGPALRGLAEQVTARSGRHVDLQLGTAPSSLPPETAIAAYRLLQEILLGPDCGTDESPVEIAVTEEDGGVRLAVRGADGVGLDNLAGRARLAGGSATEEMREGHRYLVVDLPMAWEDLP